MLVSPAEPPQLRELGPVSPLPEKHGADFLLEVPRHLVAVQRKTVPDLVASDADGRLGREIPLLQQADVGVLLIEGHPRWTADGQLLVRARGWTRERWWGLQAAAVWVHGLVWVEVSDQAHTAAWLRHAESWLSRERHRGLTARPAWAGVESFGEYLLQSFPGIGPAVARAIVAHFGGAPLRLTCEEADLATVPGVGPVRARTIAGALERK
jgi:ERCC4-type nuclease